MGFHSTPNLYIRDVVLKVSDLQQSLAFYRDFLGFKVLVQETDYASLTVDGSTPILKLKEIKQALPKQPRTTGLYHFAILLPTRAELGSFLLYLVRQQYNIGASDHLVSEALYFSDPDGNGIEVYADRPADDWTWTKDQVHMTTDPLDGQSLIKAGEGLEWSGMPSQTKMGHIHLHVSNLEEAGIFYREVLGYKVVCEYGGQALFLSTGNYHHHVAINTWNGTKRPDLNSVGLDEYTIQIPNGSYKQEVLAALRERKISFVEEEGIVRTSDPAGNRIALHL